MNIAQRRFKVVFNIIILIFLILFAVIIYTIAYSSIYKRNSKPNDIGNVAPFSLNNNDITYNSKSNLNIPKAKINAIGISDSLRKEIISRADAMTKVKWSPKYNLVDKKDPYIFKKGKTYYGVPYSMDDYQIISPKDFLIKINNSKIVYGNDCSGFVSAAWGISRQTTFSFYNAINTGSKIDNKYVSQISWNDLKPADAFLKDNGSGEGHIMLYVDSDKKKGDNLNVYEQNISTDKPFEPIPVARKDIRSKSDLIDDGYIPIRLMVCT